MAKKVVIIIVIISSIIIIGIIITIIVVVLHKKSKDDDKSIPINQNINNTHINENTTSFKISEKTVILNNGIKMPILGLGTWTLSNSETEESVYTAIKTGYRLRDTVEYYRNEEGVGRGLKKSIEEGKVKREDIFITTKIMPDAYSNPDIAIEDSLKNLDVDYIELMLIH